MKTLTVLLLSLSGTALARGGGGGGDGDVRHFRNDTTPSIESQCRQLTRLTELTALANNTTALAEKSKGDDAPAQAIQAKAAEAAPKLAEMQADATLVAACVQFQAADSLDSSCHELRKLERLEALVANTTKQEDKTRGNATRADAVRAEAEAGKARLAELQGNTTVTEHCAPRQLAEDCRDLSRLQRQVEKAATNGTAEDGERMARRKEKLAALQGNSTLVAACAASEGSKPESGSTTGGCKFPFPPFPLAAYLGTYNTYSIHHSWC